MRPHLEQLEDRDNPSSSLSSLYLALLSRPVDTAGAAYWAGKTEAQQVAGIMGSQEFFDHTGPNAWTFLDRVYTGLLHRRLDEAGRVYFGEQLAQGKSRADIVAAVFASPERVTRDSFLYIPENNFFAIL